MSGFILASGSAIRAAVLRNAGLEFSIERPRIDEEAAKASLRAEGLKPRDQADALAELKALSVSRSRPGLVLGADQMLALEDEAFDKPADLAAARAQLLKLRGRAHHLICAMVIARDGEAIWRHIETPRLTMRSFSEGFLDDYLAAVGPEVCASVGAYQLEGRGAQLFSRIEGDYFSILGVSLLPLLAFLRQHGLAGA
jgi:septum formation protein